MADTLTNAERSARMSRIRGKDTGAELVVRKLVYGMGFRYRLHAKALPGRPDLVFRKKRRVILVHGCFWHRHQDPACKLARLPKSRLDFWLPKLEGNRHRDRANQSKLERDGWRILVIWECGLRDRQALESKIKAFLGTT
jgi:DNA mismatch endonuclease (patch repair protein)